VKQDPGVEVANIFAKTQAGQREVRDRGVDLPRSARTLLVLVDGTRSSDAMLAMVKGATQSDIDALLHAGLIGPTGVARAVAGKGASVPSAAADTLPAVKLDFKELYSCLTELIREQLGVMKAFKYTLDVEKASTVDELMAVAKRFVDNVQNRRVIRRPTGFAAP